MNRLPGICAVSCCTGLPAKIGNTSLRALLLIVLLLGALPRAESAEWVPVKGKVMFGDTPLCAMVLANGQNMFSCSGDGSFNLSVPLDSNGKVTLFTFAQGFAPYRQTLSPAQVANITVNMVREPEGRAVSVDYTISAATNRAGWTVINGTIDFNGTPVCALMLANGQHMFSCNQNQGSFSLEVPSDSDGNATLFAFVSGFQPFKVVFPANAQFSNIDFSDPLLAQCVESEAASNGWNSTGDVTSLNCQQAGITSLGGVQSFVNLETLNLSGSQVDDIFLLSALTNLQELDLSSITGLTDIDTLLTLETLKTLHLNGSGNGNLNCDDLDALSLVLETFTRPDNCAASNNLTANALRVVSPDPRIGYPLEVEVSIAADESVENVGVAFFAISRDRQLPLGAGNIDLVEAGNRSYELTFNVPASVETPGTYFIGAIVDPGNAITETDEEDNQAKTEVMLDPLEFPELLPELEEPVNIAIEQAEPDRTVFLLDTTAYEDEARVGVQNADAGVTLRLGAQGAKVPIDVEAFASLRLMRSDRTGVSHDMPLYLWNSDAKRYMNAYSIDPDPFTGEGEAVQEWLPVGQIEPQLIEGTTDTVTVSDIDRRSVHLDIYFPGRLARELEVALKHLNVFLADVPPPDLSWEAIQGLRSFLFGAELEVLTSEVCVKIRPVDPMVHDRFEADNERCTALAFELPPDPPVPPEPVPLPPIFTPIYDKPVPPSFFDQLFRAGWGGSTFGFDIDFFASTTTNNEGVIVRAGGKVPVRIFGLNIDFVAVTARAQVLPDFAGAPANADKSFTLQLSALGVPTTPVRLPYGSRPPKELSFSKQKEASKLIFVGPVPVTVSAFIGGTVGTEYELKSFGPTELDLQAAPFASLDAGADARVGGFGFSVGVEGSLTLLKEKFIVRPSAVLTVRDDGFASGNADLVIQPRLRVINELTGAQGQVALFAEYSHPTVRTCKKWDIPYPCPGWETVKTPHVLDSWYAYIKVDPLTDISTLIEVVSINGAPSYYSP